ncbi:MAG: potassium-transporting ATPase subunit KdpA [Pseudomonadota bacterium]|nr:potassium-transporting ATPase subunit KdpA [Pseudomonadota bacterium]
MSANGWLQIALFAAIIAGLAVPVGTWLHRVMEGASPPGERVLGGLERLCYRLIGADPTAEMRFATYAGSVVAFSLVGMLLTFLMLLFQSHLPLNPQGFGDLSWHLALNTAVSFTTNTNWQSYGGESTMSNLSQAVALTFHNFTSAGVGIAAAVAMVRGLTRTDRAGTLGNFWRDIVRIHLYVLVPVCLVSALVMVAGGVPQTWSAFIHATTLEGAEQTIAVGPVASQVAIKMLGTNGGGFFNANAAHPFENPSPWINLIQMLSIFVIPAGLVHMYGRMTGNIKNGFAILGAMFALFLVGVGVCYAFESGWMGGAGNWEGKETRFGMAASALFATVTTDASCGAVNSMHDSFTPLGGLVPLANMQLGEVVFGGVGSGLYGMLVMVVLAVFLAGLMVGRTPELLGKKIEAKEMTLAAIYILVFPTFILLPSALAAVSEWGLAGLNNAGPHGWVEIFYAFTSGTANNGSAFAGLTANTPWYNCLLAVSMFFGRFAMMLPALAIAASLASKKTVGAGPGTFPTDGPLFTGLLVAVIVIVGALTFFPALALGPIAEHASLGNLY